MAATATRWNLVVSTETDFTLRQYLASEGRARKGGLSKFVEEAVRARVFELASRRARDENKRHGREEIETAIAEALAWSRK